MDSIGLPLIHCSHSVKVEVSIVTMSLSEENSQHSGSSTIKRINV